MMMGDGEQQGRHGSISAIEQELNRYKNIVEERLQPRLKNAVEQRDKLESEIGEYSTLKENLLLVKKEKMSEMKTLVDLGSFHVEFTIDEALDFIETKQEMLHRNWGAKRDEATELAENVRTALSALENLRRLQQME